MCNNYRNICPSALLARFFTRILLDVAEEVLPESQCSFQWSRGMIDIIFYTWQLQKNACEHQQPLFILWDFQRAFNKVPCCGLYSVILDAHITSLTSSSCFMRTWYIFILPFLESTKTNFLKKNAFQIGKLR